MRRWESQMMRTGLRRPLHPAGELGIVLEHGADARQDAPVLVAQGLDVGSGRLAGDPLG